MQTKIEGIVLSKTIFRERDIISTLLLRSGKNISVLFPGGAGGGKKKKSSLVELGHMLKIELRKSKSSSDLYGAKEWQALWQGDAIRLDHRAFFLMCFFLEVSKELSFGENLHDDNFRYDQNSVGNFRVLSNALYYIDEALIAENFVIENHCILFLSKILQEQGLFPIINECVCCGARKSGRQLIPSQGGFACSDCQGDGNASQLHQILSVIAKLAYKDYLQMPNVGRHSIEQLLAYFCYNFQLAKERFKSYQMLF